MTEPPRVPGGPLAGLRVVEGASFVAAPSAGLALAQLGAEVIRVDPPAGGSDFHRWPIAPSGASLFWSSLNKGKRSVSIDYRTEHGRELLLALATAPGPGGGIFMDNLAGRVRLTFDELTARRPDMIHVHIEGRHDGAPAVDYTINPEIGLPMMTGSRTSREPTNHVLPAWDLLAGMTAAMALLAAVNHRTTTGVGARLDVALGDIALAGVGNMGWLAEAEMAGAPRPRQGNHLYGAFGVDFETSDGRRVMVVALTEGQWAALCRATQTVEVFDALQIALGVDLRQEGERQRHREVIAAVLSPWFAQRDLVAVRERLDEARVLWSVYRNMLEVAEAAREDPASVAAEIYQPGIGAVLATGRPYRWNTTGALPVPAPALGESTDDVLEEVLGLSSGEIARLHDDGVISGPSDGASR